MQKSPILAYITPQLQSIRTVETAKSMAKRLGTQPMVVTVLPLKAEASERARSVKCLKQISEICRVDVTVRYSDSPESSIASQIAESNPRHVFMVEDGRLLANNLGLYDLVPISVVTEKSVFTVSA